MQGIIMVDMREIIVTVAKVTPIAVLIIW